MYLLVLYSDIHNIYQGINDFETILFNNYENAKKELDAKAKQVTEDFLTDGCPEEELHSEINEKSFAINNGNDYYSAEIRELEVR